MKSMQTLKPIKYFDLLKLIKIVFFSVAIIYNSGYALCTVYSRNINIVILSILAFILFILIMLERKYRETIDYFPLAFLMLMIVLLLFSTCFNYSKTELGYFIRFSLVLLNSYFFTRYIDFKTISYYFRKIMLFISIVSLIGFVLTFVLNFKIYNFLPTVINVNGVTYYNGLILFFGGYSPNVLTRNFGVFWEPGIYGSYLLIALFLQMIADKNRINWGRQIIYILALISTFSTASIILLPLVFLGYIFRNKNKQYIQTPVMLCVVITIIILLLYIDEIKPYLAKWIPSIFDKLVNETGSGNTRLYSPIANLDILRQNNYFPLGFNNADLLYPLAIQKYMSYGAQTSTTFYLMAVLGPFGIIYTFAIIFGVLKQNGLSLYSKICFVFLLLIIINKEPHTYFLFTSMVLFYLLNKNSLHYENSELEENEHNKIEKKKNKPIQKTPYIYHIKAFFINNKSLKKIKDILFKNQDNKILTTNILSTFIIKGIALIISLLSTPAYVRYFSNDSPDGIVVGVWFTLISVFSWILNFDFGIGNGLRNKLVKAFVENDYDKQKTLISSGYIMLGFISLIILIIGCILIPFFDWNNLLNISSNFLKTKTLIISVIIIFAGIITQFFLKLITSILYALQKTALPSLLTLVSSISLLLYLLIAQGKIADNNEAMILLSIAQIITVNLPLLVATIVIFLTSLKNVKPSYKYYQKESAREVTSLGIEFFVIQICLLVINSTNELLITRLFGPNYVTEYTYYNKWFHMITVFFTLLVQPMWSSVSKSYEQKNYQRINKIYKIFNAIAIAFVFGSICLSLLLQPIMNIWLKEHTIKVEFITCLYFVMATAMTLFSTAATCIANGTNRLKCQIICCIVGAIIKLPLTILLSKLLGHWNSIILVQALIILPLAIAQPIAAIKFLNKKINKGEQINENTSHRC